MNTNVVACAVLSAFGLSAGDSGLYSATTDDADDADSGRMVVAADALTFVSIRG